MNLDTKKVVSELPALLKKWLKNPNPMMLIAIGAVLIGILAASVVTGTPNNKKNDAVLNQARQSMGQVNDAVQTFRRVLTDPQVQDLAIIAASDEDKQTDLQQYVKGRLPGLLEIRLFSTNLDKLRVESLDPYGYVVLDMLLSTSEDGDAPVQMHGKGEDAYLTTVVRVGDDASPVAYMLAKASPEALIAAFNSSLSAPGILALDQYNGRFRPTLISRFANTPSAEEYITWIPIPSSLFRIGITRETKTIGSVGLPRLMLLTAGLTLLGLGLVAKLRPRKVPAELIEDPEQIESLPQDPDLTEEQGLTGDEQQTAAETEAMMDAVELPDIGFNLEKIGMTRKIEIPPVELSESIFRAYDIRGVVGETLDSEVARQVGQVVGSLAIEQDAGPVIVARDGRDSGPELIQGLIEGIASTGCDVVDIGAVPTGVLYFAAYELSNGTGVMVTGSHNPPDYNGLKMVIGGITQAGTQITDMYERIQNGNLRVGKGQVRREDMLGQYREKISSDIQLQRPLKVVADCGNGIGGVCAADVLRDIGADVISLFDEVDGTFPNHHPDPSEPKNLVDLIDAVKLMGADIGVAFDGDADRLGVVTSTGEIIYSDRLMMLFVDDVLSRVPGSTIIYDVKCTGHLHHMIEDAGGKPMMYKTGHSLIKNKMKEVDAPFAGEMSGHFFFKERWYGFDCGIYSAARLLEILAADTRDVNEVLSSLPNSVSTPELKVHMGEGENHVFVAELQEKGQFADATINTIDGVRADYPDGWGLVRASNTTPILVVRFDADTEEALHRIKEVFRHQMLAINNSLDLPF